VPLSKYNDLFTHRFLFILCGVPLSKYNDLFTHRFLFMFADIRGIPRHTSVPVGRGCC
jgi:hypothetical protein